MTRIELATKLGHDFAHQTLAESRCDASEITLYAATDEIPDEDYREIRYSEMGDEVEPEAERAYKAAFNAVVLGARS